ncbi:hypothetical protein [Haloterrigena alkaliphila]|uniref:Uncharacterized protein n=1 Tax=Haloterrigena alkaliphila TaxID=2816475 RepID=A0A8A2VH21_9EURY|nr:hypothetical protein [Haloterrigena alkaliphila]QSW99967.1 hypothetical protein J0X25_03110 [Haloterrigena alkaliphila]
MDVSDVSTTQRLAIGITLVVVGSAIAQPNLGLLTRLSAFATLFGVGFLGAAFEPPLTNAFGAGEWAELSGVKQTAILFVLAVVAIVLWVAITLGQGALAALL